MKEDDDIIECVNTQNRTEKSKLRAHKLISQVEDKVREQFLAEMQVEDEERQESRLRKNEEFEKNYREYKRQQRLAFMPMHRSLS